MMIANFLHYLAIAMAIALASIGSGIGQGLGAYKALGAFVRQPSGGDDIFKSTIIGLAFIESGIILALVITLMLLFSNSDTGVICSSNLG